MNSAVNQALVFCFAVIQTILHGKNYASWKKYGSRFQKPNDIITLGIIRIEGVIFLGDQKEKFSVLKWHIYKTKNIKIRSL